MLAKKQMSKKRKTIMLVGLLVIIIISSIIAYNTFLKKPEIANIPYYPEVYLEEETAGGISSDSQIVPTPTTGGGKELKLELFEMTAFKKLKLYIDLPIEIEENKAGNSNPFYVPAEEEAASAGD